MSMKLRECKLGEVVRTDDKPYFGNHRIGHIVGLALNRMRIIQGDSDAETIPLVKWAGEELPTPIHHANISKL